MLDLAAFQNAFVHALRERQQAPPQGIEGPEGGFSVYRNNVHVSLVDALAAVYPALVRLLGMDYFQALAREYVGQTLPETPVMSRYGATFPEFVAEFPPLARWPYLSDVARIERAWQQAYHAADAEPLDCKQLAAFGTHDPATLRLQLHPSVQVVESVWPALTIWMNQRATGVARPVIWDGPGEAVLVCRLGLEVVTEALPLGSAALLHALREGHSLAEAAQQGYAACPEHFDLSSALQVILAHGAVVRKLPF